MAAAAFLTAGAAGVRSTCTDHRDFPGLGSPSFGGVCARGRAPETARFRLRGDV